MIKKLFGKLFSEKKTKTTEQLGLQKLDFEADFETSSPYGKCLKSFSMEVDVFEKGVYLTLTSPGHLRT